MDMLLLARVELRHIPSKQIYIITKKEIIFIYIIIFAQNITQTNSSTPIYPKFSNRETNGYFKNMA